MLYNRSILSLQGRCRVSLSQLIRAMAEAGAPPEAIAIAVEAIEAAQNAVAQKRVADRDRKRRQRANTQDNDGTVTGQSRDNGGTVTGQPSPPPPLPPQTPLTPPPPHPEKQTRARKGTRLPADWQPEPLSLDLSAEVAAWPDGAIHRELARFRDWADSATGSNAIKSNWQAAWRNWVRKAHDEGRYGKPIRATSAADNRSSRLRAVDEALQFLGP